MAQDATEKRVEQALALIAKMAVEAPEAARRAGERLARWRAASMENESAWEEAMRRWEALGAMAADLRQRFEMPAPAPAGRGRERRRALLALAALCTGTALLGGMGAWYRHQPLFVQSWQTATAQLGHVALPDTPPGGEEGSHIDLDASTALEVRLYRGRRVVRLDGGEAHFEVAHDTARPFIVETRGGTVEVLGTAFTVSDRGGPVTVAVERGHVRFTPRVAGAGFFWPWGGVDIDLFGGERLTVRDGKPDPVGSVDIATVAAWRDGWLVFDNVRLDEVVATVNAYRDRPIRLADSHVAGFRFTGRFRAANSEQLLSVLPAMFPLGIETHGAGETVVVAR